MLYAAAPAVPALANKASNPAFLGVGMEDAGGVRGAGPCTITSIERGSGAEAASLQPGDVLVELEGAPVPSCDVLIALITARTPGTVVHLEVRRGMQPVKLKAELLTRDEILRRRLVGQPLPPADLLRVEDRAMVDLSEVKRATIVGWFPTSCSGCGAVLGEVARWSRERERQERRSSQALVSVLAAVGDLSGRRSVLENYDQLKLAQRSLDVPLLAADFETYTRFAMKDIDRVHFMVIDGRGVVQYVAPIVPDADDMSAALDELYAAAEQAARRTSR